MKKKILLVSHSMSRTGAPKVVLNIANSLDKSIYEVMIYNVNSSLNQLNSEIKSNVLLKEYYPLVSKLKNSRFLPVKYFFKVVGKFFNISNHFEKTLSSFKPDLVIINTIFHLYLSEITAKKGIKTVRYFHELESYIFSLSEEDKMCLLTSTDTIWACSKKVKNILESFYSKKNIEVVYPLIYLNENSQIEPEKKENFTVISAAAINFRKGFDLWVDVAIATLKVNKNIDFKWYGQANEKDPYFIDTMNKIPLSLKTRISYCGETKNLQNKLTSSDLFFLSSREDPFPIVCMEAIGTGIPCVGYKSGGIIELEENGVAKAYDLGNLRGLTKSILDFANGTTKISKEKCFEVYGSYSGDITFKRVETLIQNLIIKI